MKFSTKILIVFCGLWMALIFFLSSQNEETSSDASNSVTAIIVETIYGDETPHTPEDVNWEGTSPSVYDDLESGLVPKDDILGRSKFSFKSDVRKLAHIFIYLVLAVLVNASFLSHFKKNRLVYTAITFCICGVYAFLDELHQYFVPGRGMGMKDVLLDCSGALAGIVITAVVCAVIKLTKIVAKRIKRTALQSGSLFIDMCFLHK